MATIFLSYSRDDVDRVRPLVTALELSGDSVWWDKRIVGGDEFAGAIEQALEAADVVLVVWSKTSIASAWVRDEAATGRDDGRLVPATLDGCLPPLGFRQTQSIDLSQWNGRPRSPHLRPLLEAITAKTTSAGPRERPHLPQTTTWMDRADRGRRWAVAAGVLILISAGALVYPQISAWTGPAGLAAKVSLGEFQLISPGLPSELPQVMNQEILAAFGAENAVSVVSADSQSGKSSAPFLMDGSIRRLGPAVRFTVSLKNVQSGAMIWSRTYDHAVAEGLAPRQVSVEASQVVRCGLWGAASYQGRMSDEALALYLKFCNEFWGGSSSETMILDAARRVTVANPDFSFGWSALALAAVPLAQPAGAADADQMRAEAIMAAQKALELDPLNPEGHMALAGLLPSDRLDERERLLKKAISVRPTECGCERQAYGDFLTSVGRLEEAAEQYERARAMMPLAPNSNVRFVHALYMIGRRDEADRILSEMLEMWPNADSLRLLKMKSAFWTKRYAEALTLLRTSDLHLTQPHRDALITTFEALASNNPAQQAQAAALLRRFASDSRKNDRLIIAALAALGDREAAMEASKKLVQSRGNAHAAVLFEPNLAAASPEPRYAQLAKEFGLINYWRASKSIPDGCRQESKPAFCT